MVKIGKRRTRYVPAVVPGDARLDLEAVKDLLEATYAAFAGRDKAEELAGSPSGTVLPFSYHPRLELIADPALLGSPKLFYNAARLDRSIALSTDDYRRMANPRLAPIRGHYAIGYEPLFTAMQIMDVQAMIEPWFNLIQVGDVWVR
ncbi:hypothetical protein Acsp03_58820 [Actinomadura sp. NBRC 104412]|uniref:YbaK/EbsC family protein n=1 Tax=Actinomadura sp. NBRC 104412 TaxID=3032203 RepID=UPI0024A312B3|nr:YbaK/EbsC family protein [Actinomadura sp. NBRC 104412]GLZ08416.1 hypothetical protein Acsp03_58820 [Actinomadura sp. NBRC 104412]